MAKKEIDGTVIDAKSIIKSLKIIKAVCEDNNTACKMCPFCHEYDDNYGCIITDLEPDNWKINEENTVWRALL